MQLTGHVGLITLRLRNNMPKTLKRSLWQRLMGIPATPLASDTGAWAFANEVVEADLNRLPELNERGSGVRLEGQGLPHPLLLVYGEDDEYRAFENRCRHAGRRLDPIPGAGTLQCCSLSKATYNGEGKPISGPAKGPLQAYPVEVEGKRLRVKLN